MPQLRTLALRVPNMRGIAEGIDALLGARFLLVAPRAAERRVEAVRGQRLLQRLRLHHVGIERAAMRDRRDAVAHALLVGVHDEIDPEPLRLGVAEGDHLAELPGRVDMQQGKRRLGGVEGLAREMQHHRGVLADRVEHHRMAELGHHLAHDVDALGLELPQICREALLHDFAPDCRPPDDFAGFTKAREGAGAGADSGSAAWLLPVCALARRSSARSSW